MKEIKKIATAENFTAVSVGKLNELDDYVLELTPEIKIPGKVFCGASLRTTGSEFSFQMFQPKTETGFLHTHKSHEELYFSLAEQGNFRWTEKYFLYQKEALFGFPRQVNVLSVIMAPCL